MNVYLLEHIVTHIRHIMYYNCWCAATCLEWFLVCQKITPRWPNNHQKTKKYIDMSQSENGC